MIRTKIIATLGPASVEPAVLAQLIDAGVDVFRLNFSHGTHESHGLALRRVRAAAAAARQPVAVMGDLCGPKIRLNEVSGGSLTLKTGDAVSFVRGDAPATARALTISYPRLIDEAQVGHRLLIDDGLVRLRAVGRSADSIECTVEIGGVISSRKGVNLPDTRLTVSALTDKDRRDAEWALQSGVDYVALSFVRTGDDVAELRRLLDACGPAAAECRIVSKIEKPEAISHLDDIIEQSDVILVARGDLGVEMPLEQVPMLQKVCTHRCHLAGKPVIIATQMLQSMVEAASPTRAEVSDVANAILDRADVLMLSAETAVGKFPVQAVRTLCEVARQTETYLEKFMPRAELDSVSESLRTASAVARGASLVARDLDAALVAVWTKTGTTAGLLSKHRLPQQVIGLCENEATWRRMAMYFGVVPLLMPQDHDPAAMLSRLDAALLERGLAHPGALVVVITGTRLTQPGSTNSLLIHLVAPPAGP